MIGKNVVAVSGTGSWKSLTVANAYTGVVIDDNKVYIAVFEKVMKDPEFAGYVESLLEAALVRKINVEEMDIDPESYEEVRSVAMGLDAVTVSPED